MLRLMLLSLWLSASTAAWWQNITGVLDVTAPPYNADNTGSRDATAALQAAIDFARINRTVVFLPLGVYQVTAQLNVSMVTRANGVVIEGQIPTLGGTAATMAISSAPPSPQDHQRPVLFVPPNTPAFRDQAHPRYVLCFYHYDRALNWSMPDQNFNQVLRGVDIRVGRWVSGVFVFIS